MPCIGCGPAGGKWEELEPIIGDELAGIEVTVYDFGRMSCRPQLGGIMSDPFDLDRFVQAQASDFDQALAEVKAGRKHSHWMWYIFPQIDGLGSSSMAKRYAIKSKEEAEAYLAHPVLGPGLIEITEAALGVEAKSASQIFGSPDDMKLKSSATLFEAVSQEPAFARLLDKYFKGERDSRTLQILGADD